jgi:hypothetical protein
MTDQKKLLWARHGGGWKLIVDRVAYEVVSFERGYMNTRVIDPDEPTPPTPAGTRWDGDSVGSHAYVESAADPLWELTWRNAMLAAEIKQLRAERPASVREHVVEWWRNRRERIRTANALDGEAELW